MHELSIAMNIVELAEEEGHRIGTSRIQAVHLRLGTMAGVAKEALLFCYGAACEGTSLEGSCLVIDESDGQHLDIIGLEVE